MLFQKIGNPGFDKNQLFMEKFKKQNELSRMMDGISDYK